MIHGDDYSSESAARCPSRGFALVAMKNAKDWINTGMLKNPFKYSIDIAKMSVKDPIRAGYMTTGAPNATAPGVLWNYGKVTFDPTAEAYSYSYDAKNNPYATKSPKKLAEEAAAVSAKATAAAAAAKATNNSAATATARDTLLRNNTILGQSQQTNRAGTPLYTV